SNGDISGEFNWVMDPQTGKRALGRFGWKAGQTKLITQNQSAFNEDMGLTSNIRPIKHEPPAFVLDVLRENLDKISRYPT
ncbi:di-heme oxidoredictase family protein, partial [Pseudomonas sp. SIMBA_064]